MDSSFAATRATGPLGRHSVFELVCREVFARGGIGEEQRRLLKRMQKFLRLPPEEAREILDAARRAAEAGDHESEESSRVATFENACDLGWSDGDLTDRELAILKGLAAALGLDQETGQRILDETHARSDAALRAGFQEAGEGAEGDADDTEDEPPARSEEEAPPQEAEGRPPRRARPPAPRARPRPTPEPGPPPDSRMLAVLMGAGLLSAGLAAVVAPRLAVPAPDLRTQAAEDFFRLPREEQLAELREQAESLEHVTVLVTRPAQVPRAADLLLALHSGEGEGAPPPHEVREAALEALLEVLPDAEGEAATEAARLLRAHPPGTPEHDEGLRLLREVSSAPSP